MKLHGLSLQTWDATLEKIIAAFLLSEEDPRADS
jgi:hypothetical protein